METDTGVVFALGSYNQTGSPVRRVSDEGISLVEFDTKSGEMHRLSSYTDILNPSYLAWDDESRRLYAVSENLESAGEVHAFGLSEDYKLRKLFSAPGPGVSACHIAVDKNRDLVFSAAYIDGRVQSRRLASDRFEKAIVELQLIGSGPNTGRQASPHAHQVVIDERSGQALVCDLGSDKVWGLNLQDLTGPPSTVWKAPGGNGPRHLVIDPATQMIIVLCELVPNVFLLDRRGEDTLTGFETIQELKSTSGDFSGNAQPAAIKIHPSGNSVAVSNRGVNTISIFKVKRDTPQAGISLVHIDEFESRGQTPRDIEFSPDGRWLLIANQDSNEIHCRQFNAETGEPESSWGPPLAVKVPACVLSLGG